MILRYLIGISILFYFASPVYATIYKWTDEKGEIHFTDDQKKIPEKYKENARDFDKIEKKGSVTYDPALGANKQQKNGEEPFWKRFLREEETLAKKADKPKVVLYMADWWPACREAKSYFVRKGIAFTEVNIDRNKKGRIEMLKKSGGYSGIPVIDVNGTILLGFNKRAIEKALKQ